MDRKKCLAVFVVIIFLMAGVFHLNANLKNKDLSDFTLVNIEALAQGEGGGSTCTVIGYERIWSDGCLYDCAKCAEGYYQALALIECVAR